MATEWTEGNWKCVECDTELTRVPWNPKKQPDRVIRCQKCWTEFKRARDARNTPKHTQQRTRKPTCAFLKCTNEVSGNQEFCTECNPTLSLKIEYEAGAGTFSTLAIVFRNGQPAKDVKVYYAVSQSTIAWKTETTNAEGIAKFTIPYTRQERKVCFVVPGAETVTVTIPVKPGTKPEEIDEPPEFSKAVSIFADVVQGTLGVNIYVCTRDVEGNPVPAPVVCTISGCSQLKPYTTSDGVNTNDHVGTAMLRLEGCERPRQARLYLVGGDPEQGMIEVDIPPRIFSFQEPEIPLGAAIEVDADVFEINQEGKIEVQVQTYCIVDGKEVQEACHIGYQTDDIPLTVTHTSDGIVRRGDDPEKYYPKGMTVIELDAIPTKPTKMSIHVYGRKADVKKLDLPYRENVYQPLPVVAGIGFRKNFVVSLVHGLQTR